MNDISFRAITQFLDCLSFRLHNNAIVSHDGKKIEVLLFKSDLKSYADEIKLIIDILRIGDSSKFHINFHSIEFDENFSLEFIFNKISNHSPIKAISSFLLESLALFSVSHSYTDIVANNTEKYNFPTQLSGIKPYLWLTYVGNKLLLNDKYEICKCNPGSGNDSLLKFLIKHPNKTWTRDELKNQPGVLITNVIHTRDADIKPLDKNLDSYIDDMNLRVKDSFYKIGELFFGVDLGNHTIHLRNPIYDPLLLDSWDIDFSQDEEVMIRTVLVKKPIKDRSNNRINKKEQESTSNN